MIDFISTHPDASPQTVACARLLAAVIAQAIDDASNKHASALEQDTAIGWLFDKSSLFKDYAALIGADAGMIRKALLEPAGLNEPKNSRFDASRRRQFRSSYVKWLSRREAERNALKEMEAKV